MIFEYFSRKFCLNFLTLILSASPNMMHFVCTFSTYVLKAEGGIYGKIVYIKNIFENGWWEDAYPTSYPLAMTYRNHQKSLVYFSPLAPLILFLFTKGQSQKGGGHGTMPSPKYLLVSTFRPKKVLMVRFLKKNLDKKKVFVVRDEAPHFSEASACLVYW